MKERKILLIGGRSITQTGNHRVHHLLACLQAWDYPLDVIGQVNFYNGPPANARTRFSAGLRAMRSGNVAIEQKGNTRWMIVHKLPGIFVSLLQEWWAYFQVRPHLERSYPLGIFGHPRNAVLARLLKRSGFIDNLIYDDWDYFPTHITTVNNRLDTFIMQQREKICVSEAGAIFSVSARLAELRRRQGARRVYVVPNGVDSAHFQPAQQKKPHPPTLIFMGSLYAAWGVDLVVRALPALAARFPDVRFLIIGEGPEEQNLRRLAFAELGLEQHVIFTGLQPYQKLPEYMAEADIGTLTYHPVEFVRYASSLKACEYMAAGLPVIATRFGEISDFIEKSQAGAIIDATPEAFAAAAGELLTDRARFQTCAANAIHSAAAYDWERVFDPIKGLVQAMYTQGAAVEMG